MIKSIDLQVAVQRVTDHAKDAAGQLRRHDASQQFSNYLQTVEDERAKSAIRKKHNADAVAIGKERGGSGQEKGKKRQKKQPSPHSALEDLDVGDVAERKLDIGI